MKKNWEIRRDLMKEAWTAENKNVAYIVIDLIDWNTNIKRFKDAKAMSEWALYVCENYHVDKETFKAGWENLINEGYLEISRAKNGAVEVKATSPVEPEKPSNLSLVL